MFGFLINQVIDQMDLLKREEFDVQTQILSDLCKRVEELSNQLKEIENFLERFSKE